MSPVCRVIVFVCLIYGINLSTLASKQSYIGCFKNASEELNTTYCENESPTSLQFCIEDDSPNLIINNSIANEEISKQNFTYLCSCNNQSKYEKVNDTFCGQNCKPCEDGNCRSQRATYFPVCKMSETGGITQKDDDDASVAVGVTFGVILPMIIVGIVGFIVYRRRQRKKSNLPMLPSADKTAEVESAYMKKKTQVPKPSGNAYSSTPTKSQKNEPQAGNGAGGDYEAMMDSKQVEEGETYTPMTEGNFPEEEYTAMADESQEVYVNEAESRYGNTPDLTVKKSDDGSPAPDELYENFGSVTTEYDIPAQQPRQDAGVNNDDDGQVYEPMNA